MNLFVNYTLGFTSTNKPLQTKTKHWQCLVFQCQRIGPEVTFIWEGSVVIQGVLMGVWIEKVRKILGEDITEEWGSSWNKCGGSLIFWGSCFLFLWGCTIRWWHEHGPHSQDTSAMWVKAEDHHSQTTVFPPPPHPPYPPRICDHFPKPCHLLSSSLCLFFPPSGLKNTIHLSHSIHKLHTCTCLDPTMVFFISVLTVCIRQVEGEERPRLPPAFAFLTLSSCHCYDEK